MPTKCRITALSPLHPSLSARLVQLANKETAAQHVSHQPLHGAALLWRDACINQHLWDSKWWSAELSGLLTAHVEVCSSADGAGSVQAAP